MASRLKDFEELSAKQKIEIEQLKNQVNTQSNEMMELK